MQSSVHATAQEFKLPRHRQDSTVLCRFVDDIFETVEIDFRRVQYVAFSHVWGHPSSYSLTSIRNIPQQIIATPSKARFLDANLQSLVGNKYFWLDVICIDQSESPEAADERIQATAIMPDIYSHAQKTIVIRDGSGFPTCCAEVIGNFRTWKEYDTGKENWATHWRKDHLGKMLYEGVLERLWPLQESVLSNHIQFVACESQLRRMSFSFDTFTLNTQWMEAHLDRLWVTSRAWASYGTDGMVSDDEQLAFIKALLNNGETVRSERTRYNNSIGSEFRIQSNSTRKTSKARDLILSTMSQYEWYKPPSPQDIRKISFGELFRNCFEQARHARSATLSKITAGMVDDEGEVLETSLVPEPQCLGDVVKLFGLATQAGPRTERDCASGLDFGSIHVRHADSTDARVALTIIENSLEFSEMAWQSAWRGELSMSDISVRLNHRLFSETVSEQVCEEQSLRLLNIILTGHFNGGDAAVDAESYKNDLIAANPGNYSRVLIRIAALVSCGVGVSALTWSKKFWTPILVSIGQQELLGVISTKELSRNQQDGNVLHYAAPIDSTTRITYRHFVITRLGDGHKPQHRCVGLIPDFYTFGESETVFLSRMDKLGFNANTKYALPVVNLV